jgi:hypothetical protein
MPRFLARTGKLNKAKAVARRCRKATGLLGGDRRVTYFYFYLPGGMLCNSLELYSVKVFSPTVPASSFLAVFPTLLFFY